MELKEALEIILELAGDNMIDPVTAFEEGLGKHFDKQQEAHAVVSEFIKAMK